MKGKVGSNRLVHLRDLWHAQMGLAPKQRERQRGRKTCRRQACIVREGALPAWAETPSAPHAFCV